MEKFEESYLNLNDEQKRAVDHIDGPLLVVAGPGTGKTQLLSLRAAQILRKSDSSASNILCMTYTNKAAINMKERLLNLIGPEANAITVKTFHSFASDIINNHPSYFWNGARLRAMPNTRQLEVVEEILAKLPLSHPLALKFAGQFTLVDTVIKAIAIAKENGLTPEKLRSILLLNIAYINEIEDELADILGDRLTEKSYQNVRDRIFNLKSMELADSIAPLKPLDEVLKNSFEEAMNRQLGGKKGAVSAWKSKWLTNINGKKVMDRERKRNAWWLSLCDVYEDYQNQSHLLGFYDLSDLIIEVIQAIERHPDLKADLQEQFTHIMIDEFQDTNLAQGRLSYLIADRQNNEGKPNIMAVGDDDQTIYRFQGAELNNMRAFIDHFSADVIVLTRNYRSTQEILDLSKNVIEQAESRLVNLISGLDKNLTATDSSSSYIKFKAYDTDAQQYQSVVDEAVELSKNGSVAILARKNSSLVSLAQFFTAKDIPISYEQQSNLFDDEIINLIIQIIRAIASLHNGDFKTSNALISELIRNKVWGINPKTLWEFAIINRKKNDWLQTLLECSDTHISSIGHWLLWLSTICNNEPAVITLEHIIGLQASQHMTSPIMEHLKNNGRVISSLSAINQLKQLLMEHGSKRSTLIDLYDIITRLQNNHKSLTDTSLYVKRENAIELLSAHKSKGLEFDSVIIIDAIDTHWSPNRSNAERTPPSNLPLKNSGDEKDDYARLLYVAMTRAKKNLLVTSYKYNHKNDPVLITSLVSATLHEESMPLSSEDDLEDQLVNALKWPRLDSVEEKSFLLPLLEEYKLSATHLTTFLDVTKGGPVNFLEKYLLKLPSSHSDKLAFGRAMHGALEKAQLDKINNKFGLGLTINYFEEELNQELLSREAFERYLNHGKDTLEKLFKEYGFELDPNALPEQMINTTIEGGIRLNGKLDVIHKNNDSVWFDDYKTGKPIPKIDSTAKNNIKAWNQRKQITFYALLLNKSSEYSSKNLVSANMIYLEAENITDLKKSYLPSSEEVNELEMLINSVWRHIMELDFPDTSSYDQNVEGINKFCEDLVNNFI